MGLGAGNPRGRRTGQNDKVSGPCHQLMGMGRLLAASPCEGLATSLCPTQPSRPRSRYRLARMRLRTARHSQVCPRSAGSLGRSSQPPTPVSIRGLTSASGWNGKFAGADNGGFGGVINYAKIGDALSHNYASASHRQGHTAGSLGVDASGHSGIWRRSLITAIARFTKRRDGPGHRGGV